MSNIVNIKPSYDNYKIQIDSNESLSGSLVIATRVRIEAKTSKALCSADIINPSIIFGGC